jgi:hypothetical protein
MKKLYIRLIAIATLCLANFSAFALSALPTTGTCGFAISGSFPFTGVQLLTSSNFASGGLNWLGTIDFAAQTIYINSVSQTAKGATASGNTTGNPQYTNTQNSGSATFTSAASTTITGMYILTLSNGGTLNLIPLNSGQTFLMQLFNSTDMGGRVGVCQI